MASLTDLRSGQTLTGEAVRSSLRNLFATQHFADLWIETAVSGDESDVVIAYALAPRVLSIDVTGQNVPVAGRLREALPVRKGSYWQAMSGEISEARIRRILADRGYLDARIQTRVEESESPDTVDVRFEVTAGPRATLTMPLFLGDLKDVAPEALAKDGRFKPGDPHREQRVRESAGLYARSLRKKGYLRAEVRHERVEYEAATARATPVYSVFTGPKVVLEVNGVDEKDIREHPMSPWSQDSPVDEDALRVFAGVLRNELQEEGHAKATVEVSFKNEPGEEKVVFDVSKRERYAIASIGFAGNAVVSRKDLLSAVKTRARGFLTGGRLVDRQLAEDQSAVASLYRERGFNGARVLTTEVTEASGRNLLNVVFSVDEGLPTTIRERRFEGAITLAGVSTSSQLLTAPGKPYYPAALDADVALIRSMYSERGFIDARVDGVAESAGITGTGPVVDVVFRIFEGVPVRFGKTVIRGTAATSEKVVRDQLAHHEGEPFTFSKLTATEQNLARLGIFERIDISGLPPDPGSDGRTVVLEVAESRPWSLLYGLGAEYNETASNARLTPRVSLSVSNGNLFGRALLGTIEGRYSQRDSRLLARFQERAVFGGKLPISLAAFWSRYFRSDFEIERTGAFLEAERRLAAAFKVTARLQYEIVNPVTDDPSLERQDRPARISSIGTSITLDKRDDAIEPNKGVLVAADLKYAFPFLTTDADFLKAYLQTSYVHPLRTLRLVGALRVGWVWNRRACHPESNPTCMPNLEVPVVERFFAGGRTTHRAFPLDDLGIEGETLSDGTGIGGNALVLGNVELRVPVFGGLGVAVFVDAGNTFGSPQSVRVEELRYGAGAGLFYMSPVGPIRLEYGFKLDRRPLEDAGAVNFSIGYPF
jgi:outer membrane protein insertion porin family